MERDQYIFFGIGVQILGALTVFLPWVNCHIVDEYSWSWIDISYNGISIITTGDFKTDLGVVTPILVCIAFIATFLRFLVRIDRGYLNDVAIACALIIIGCIYMMVWVEPGVEFYYDDYIFTYRSGQGPQAAIIIALVCIFFAHRIDKYDGVPAPSVQSSIPARSAPAYTATPGYDLYCPRCGRGIAFTNDAKFCPNCGRDIDSLLPGRDSVREQPAAETRGAADPPAGAQAVAGVPQIAYVQPAGNPAVAEAPRIPNVGPECVTTATTPAGDATATGVGQITDVRPAGDPAVATTPQITDVEPERNPAVAEAPQIPNVEPEGATTATTPAGDVTPRYDLYCPGCGQGIVTSFTNNVKFCSNCGRDIRSLLPGRDTVREQPAAETRGAADPPAGAQAVVGAPQTPDVRPAGDPTVTGTPQITDVEPEKIPTVTEAPETEGADPAESQTEH